MIKFLIAVVLLISFNFHIFGQSYKSSYVHKGVMKANAGNYKGAIKEYSRALEEDPNNYIALVDRGLAKVELKDYHGPLQDYNKPIKINPHFEKPFLNNPISKKQL